MVVRPREPHIRTMSYCSGEAKGLAWSEIGLPMKSDRPARCWLSSSNSISTTDADATTVTRAG